MEYTGYGLDVPQKVPSRREVLWNNNKRVNVNNNDLRSTMEPSYKTRPFVSSLSQNLMQKQRKNYVSLTFLSTFHSGEKTMAYYLWTGQLSFNPVI